MSSAAWKIPVYTKPPQSGKTQDAIIVPMSISISKGRVPVVIIPPRIQLQKQLNTRVSNSLGIGDSEIGKFDTGSVETRLGSYKQAIKLLESKKLKCFIVLNNTHGIDKLLLTMALSGHKFDVIVDEIHGFLKTPPQVDNKFSEKPQEFETIIKQTNKSLRPLNLDKLGRLAILIHMCKTRDFNLIGTTATVSFIAQSKIVKSLNINPTVVKIDVPECYHGWKDIPKKYYKDNYTDAIRKILKRSPLGTITMCHVGNAVKKHIEAAQNWVTLCKQQGHYNTCAIIDNSEGYTIYNSDMVPFKYDKKSTTEPWVIVNKCLGKRYRFIGIFGDRCMSESNTYQKCNDEVNCPINDMIVMPCKTSLDDMTLIIQKVGRIFGNDSNENRRTIWVVEGDNVKIERGMKLDDKLQDEGQLGVVDYPSVKKSLSASNNYGKKTTNYENTEKRFMAYRKHNTKIAMFVRSLDNSRISYAKKELLDRLSDAGYEHPEQMLNTFCTDDNFAFYLFERELETYTWVPGILEVHRRVFLSS